MIEIQNILERLPEYKRLQVSARYYYMFLTWTLSYYFPCGLASKESACNVRDPGLIPGLGRSPGEGKGYPLQYSGLENPMD